MFALLSFLKIGHWFFDAEGALKAGWQWITATPVHLLIALCVSLSGGVWFEHHEAAKWEKVAIQRGNTITAMQSASKEELARAQAEHDAAAKHEKEMNDDADKRVAAARVGDAARLDDYKHRLFAAFGASDGQPVPATGQADVAQGSNGPGGFAKLDETLSADLAKCTVNSRRLLEIHNEAIADNAPPPQLPAQKP